MSDTVSYAHTGPTQITWRLSDDMKRIDVWIRPDVAVLVLAERLNAPLAGPYLPMLDHNLSCLRDKAKATTGSYPLVTVHVVDPVPDIPPKETPTK